MGSAFVLFSPFSFSSSLSLCCSFDLSLYIYSLSLSLSLLSLSRISGLPLAIENLCLFFSRSVCPFDLFVAHFLSLPSFLQFLSLVVAVFSFHRFFFFLFIFYLIQVFGICLSPILVFFCSIITVFFCCTFVLTNWILPDSRFLGFCLICFGFNLVGFCFLFELIWGLFSVRYFGGGV